MYVASKDKRFVLCLRLSEANCIRISVVIEIRVASEIVAERPGPVNHGPVRYRSGRPFSPNGPQSGDPGAT